jgi:hypothetical protein
LQAFDLSERPIVPIVSRDKTDPAQNGSAQSSENVSDREQGRIGSEYLGE